MRLAQRSARAFSKSLDTYEQERKRSAKEKRDGAIEDFNQAIRINPRHPEAYVNLGLVRLQQGKKTEAQRAFKRSLELKPSLRTFIESRINQISSN